MITHPKICAFLCALSTCCITQMGYAFDARSAALGGSAIANGKGVHGTLENPSTLMRLKRKGERFHFHAGANVDIRDETGVLDELSDEEDLVDRLDAEIDRLTDVPLTCDALTADADTLCLTDTAELGDLSSRLADIFQNIDGRPLAGSIGGDIGVASTSFGIPFAIHFRTAFTGVARSDIATADLDYVQSVSDALIDNELTFGEVLDSSPLSLDANTGTLEVDTASDELVSEVEGSGLARAQVGISFATSISLIGFDWDIGITPKFSRLTAGNFEENLQDNFDSVDDENELSFNERFEENQVEASSTTVDVGVTTSLPILPIRISVVARNMIAETITTNDGFKFETTPQLIVGGAFDLGSLTFSGDVALNEAKVDNLETQVISVGAEYSKRFFALRAGLSHDNSRIEEATSFSLGFGLGPLQVGGRLTDVTQALFGAQITFGF